MADLVPAILSIGNASSATEGTSLDLQTTVAKEFTMIVSAQGSPTFSVALEGAQAFASGGPSCWVELATLTAPGVVTVSTHWMRWIRANLKSVSGGTPPVYITAQVAAGGA